jgi:LPS-assembly protein
VNFQIDDTNLFLPQRFPGLDRVDTGGRFVYGANSTWYFPAQRLVQWFLGHSLRLDRRRVAPFSSGEDQRASDIVSRFRLTPMSGLQFLNRVALKYKTRRPRISDTSAILGKKLLNLQLTHTFVSKRSTPDGIGVSQATWAVGTQPLDHWRFSLGETRNLKRHQRGSLSRSVSAVYQDECFQATITAFRSRSSDRDIRPSSGFIVQFDFKNLGSINPLNIVGINANNIL